MISFGNEFADEDMTLVVVESLSDWLSASGRTIRMHWQVVISGYNGERCTVAEFASVRAHSKSLERRYFVRERYLEQKGACQRLPFVLGSAQASDMTLPYSGVARDMQSERRMIFFL